jgi:TRAP-type C4-dicarboxylate transport system permease small subunit
VAWVLAAYGRLAAGIDRVLMVLLTVAFAAVVGLNGAEMVGRTVFGTSSVYYAEASLTLSALVWFAGYAVLLHRDEDVRLDWIYDRLAPSVRRLLDLLIEAGTVLFFGVVVSASWSYFQLGKLMMHPVFSVPQSYTVAPVLIGSALCLFMAVHRTIIAAVAVAEGGASQAGRP